MEIYKRMLANSIRYLGKPRESNQCGGIRYLRGFVQEDGGIFEAEDFLNAVFIIESANPNARAIRQGKIAILPVLLERHARETKIDHLRQRPECDGSPRSIGPKTQYGMT